MPRITPNTIAERLNTARVAVANSMAEAGIQSLVEAYGYSSMRLTDGQSLFDAAQAAVNAQKAAEGAKRVATQEQDRAEKAARDAYMALAKVARAVFQADKARLTALGLTGPAPRDTPGFLAAAVVLFDNASLTPGLADYGYDTARLEGERARITAFASASEKQQAAMGAAQQATREQDAALRSLDAWRAQYIKIARVALRNEPQLLEKIGVPARTSKTAAQKAAGRRKTGEG